MVQKRRVAHVLLNQDQSELLNTAEQEYKGGSPQLSTAAALLCRAAAQKPPRAALFIVYTHTACMCHDMCMNPHGTLPTAFAVPHPPLPTCTTTLPSPTAHPPLCSWHTFC